MSLILFRNVVAIAGDDYSIIAADTRLSTGYSIYTRKQKKLFKLSDNTVLGCAGCWCDVLTLSRVLAARMQVCKLQLKTVCLFYFEKPIQ